MPGPRPEVGFGARAGLLLALAAALLLPAAGGAPLARAEIYFVDAARSMVESGDWLVPRFRGEPFFDKPALTYWLIAAAFRAFGFTLEAARLVPALAALLSILATLWLGRLLVSPGAALGGGLALATTLGFLSFGRIAMSDMPLTLFTTLSLALAVVLARADGSRPWLAATGLGAALGLGFLTKGPIALILPGLGVLGLVWLRRRRLPSVTATSLALVGVVFALTGLGWFALLYRRLGSAPLAHFFLRENLERFAGETYDSGRAPWYYLAAYLAEGLPWSLFLPMALAGLLRDWRAGRATEGPRLLALWLGLMALPLSLSRGKLDYYLLPLYPAASLLVGDCLAREWTGGERRFGRAVAVAVGMLVGLSPLLPARLPALWRPAPSALRALALLAGALALWAAVTAFRFSQRSARALLATSASVAFFAGAAIVVPAFDAAQPNASIVADVARERAYEPDLRFVFCEDPTLVARDLLFETRVASLERCDLWNPASSHFPFLVLLRKSQRGDLLSIPDLRLVGEYRFVPASALTLKGLVGQEPADDLAIVANYWTADPQAKLRFRKLRKRVLREAEESGDRR